MCWRCLPSSFANGGVVTVRYFSPVLKLLIGTETAKRHGRDAWWHVMACMNAHELSDCEVRDWGEFALEPFSLSRAKMMAEQSANYGRNHD